MVIIFLRSIILYALVIFSIRLMGKRQIGELQPTELVITILISNIATLPLEDMETPLVVGVVPILSLVCFDVLMSYATLKSKKLRRAVTGSAKIIIRDGKIDQKVLRDLRFSADDLLTAIRSQNIFNINEVQFAIVETNGNISVYQKKSDQPVTNKDINIQADLNNPPDIIISEGVLCENGLNASGLGREWLSNILKKNVVDIKDVFLLTADSNGDYTLIERD